jgi:hypothetical protein
MVHDFFEDIENSSTFYNFYTIKKVANGQSEEKTYGTSCNTYHRRRPETEEDP